MASVKASGATPARKSRTVRRNSSGSSLGGEWPDFSKITNCESGMSDAMVSDIATGGRRDAPRLAPARFARGARVSPPG